MSAPKSGSKVVITTFKNEAPYILEWVSHYRVLGFDHIVVFTNDCTDGTNRILTRLEEMGDVTFRINKVGAGGIHRSALRQAARLEVVKAADWVFVCDVDEFLNIHVGDHKIDDLIAATGDVDAIAVPWKIFSNTGRTVLRNTPVTRQFTDAELPPVEGGATRRFVKTLFRQKDIYQRIGLHAPIVLPEHADGFTWATPGAARRQTGTPPGQVSRAYGYATAQLNHYAVRSVESYLVKRHRGRANHSTHTLGLEYWDRWNRGGEEDLTIARYAPAIEAEMARYMADETLSRLHRKGFRWHKAKIEELKADPDYIALGKSCASRLTGTAPANDTPAPPMREALALAGRRPVHAGPNLPVGTLWTGAGLSFLEQMCLLSFVEHGHPVSLFSYGPVANLPDEITLLDAHDILEDPGAPSEIFRLHMIARTGMIWTGRDRLCLRPIQPDEGHVHGFFDGPMVSNALLRLPPEGETLARYLDYAADPAPIPPWWGPEARTEAEAAKKAGQWSPLPAQAHDICGPAALTHFLRETGDLAYSRPSDEDYPIPADGLGDLVSPQAGDGGPVAQATRTIGLSGLRAQLSLAPPAKGSFLYKILEALEINPVIAPIADQGALDRVEPALMSS